ncbi:hypothetical protein FEM48_Zijuj01G0076400 [Ziziphus jujuba var. spinosa]|uniref:Uncharacterized protein n=1 Tax=Ziziphus jujuba var. spinosa TaxID=714518 RepID=A0A978VZZ1_ZIZJJ|nr:hypothetical protein FEM48_Zijuj01G0076400 [Ziziphus jujuba var. spinosa]
MEDERRTILLSNQKDHELHEGIELKSFMSFLKWVCVDQSSLWRASLSWSVFLFLAIGVPVLSHFLLDCSSTCDADHTRPYHVPVQISLSLFATLSFFCISRWARKYGLRRFLFIDKLFDHSEKVRHGYKEQLQVCIYIYIELNSVNLVSFFFFFFPFELSSSLRSCFIKSQTL